MSLPTAEDLARLPDPADFDRPTRHPLLPFPGINGPAPYGYRGAGARCDPEWAVRLARRYEVPLLRTIEDLQEIASSMPQRVYAGSSGKEMPPQC
jgi:hypothetical protein